MQGLVQDLEELGIDVSELDVDFEGELSFEEYTRVQDAIFEAQKQRIKEEFLEELRSDQIECYHPDVMVDGEYTSAEQLDSIWQEREAIGLNARNELSDDFLEGLDVGGSFASTLYDSVAAEFLSYAEDEISSKRSGKVDFVAEILDNDSLEPNNAIEWFEKKDELDFREFNEALFSDDTNLELGKDDKVYDQTIEHYWDDIKKRRISDKGKVKMGALLDVTKALEGLVQNRDDPEEFNRKVQSFQNPLHKFRPEEYEKRLEDADYTIFNVWNRRKTNLMSYEVGTCLTDYEDDDFDDVFKENKLKEAHTMYEDDPFTFFQAIGKDGDLVGYTRSFLMEDSDDQLLLAVDAIEASGVNGVEMEDIWKDMEERKDIICAGALGTISLGDELGVDYVAGKDARVKFGPRQAYSNTSRDITYEKVGDPVPYYSAVPTTVVEESDRHPYSWIKNIGKVSNIEWLDDGGWRYERDTKKLGSAIYHEPGEQEVRGFQTEPGQHTTEAKILMEFP